AFVSSSASAADLAESRARSASLSREEMSRSIQGLRVLVVDDERDTRESFRQILADFGADVVVAASVSDALDAIERHHPQVMLCDIGMPEGDGYQLIRKVRSLARRQDREIRAAALTAFTGIQDRARAIESGFQMFLAKPVEATRLGEAVARLAMMPR